MTRSFGIALEILIRIPLILQQTFLGIMLIVDVFTFSIRRIKSIHKNLIQYLYFSGYFKEI